jgi:spore maturation protein CgeB
VSGFRGTRVLFIGRLDESIHAHNALRCRALERLGCSVATLDPGQAGWLERLARRDFETRLVKALDTHKPQLVVANGGFGLDANAIKSVRSRYSARWVNWFPGDLRVVNPARQLAPAYDRMYMTGTDVTEEVQRGGVSHAVFLPLGCDPSVHKPLRAKGPFRANVVFAGVATPRREQLLNELVEFGIAVWGDSWKKTSLRDFCRGELPTVEDYVRAYAGATVGINIHHVLDDDPAHQGRGCNQRLFELSSIGVAQVVDARADLPLHFDDGREVLVFENPAQLKGQVKRALQEDAYRDRLANAARQRSLSNHTYMHRMSILLTDALQGSSKA